MERIIEILMRRDGYSRKEAVDIVNDVRSMMKDCNYDPDKSEEIFVSELGLEIDYIPDLLMGEWTIGG